LSVAFENVFKPSFVILAFLCGVIISYSLALEVDKRRLGILLVSLTGLSYAVTAAVGVLVYRAQYHYFIPVIFTFITISLVASMMFDGILNVRRKLIYNVCSILVILSGTFAAYENADRNMERKTKISLKTNENLSKSVPPLDSFGNPLLQDVEESWVNSCFIDWKTK
jgi:hypothetical protein